MSVAFDLLRILYFYIWFFTFNGYFNSYNNNNYNNNYYHNRWNSESLPLFSYEIPNKKSDGT